MSNTSIAIIVAIAVAIHSALLFMEIKTRRQAAPAKINKQQKETEEQNLKKTKKLRNFQNQDFENDLDKLKGLKGLVYV